MQSDAPQHVQDSATSQHLGRSSHGAVGRVIRDAFLIVGAVADILGIFGYGQAHQWWTFQWWTFGFTASPGAIKTFWMLVLGIGGPWMMIIGAAGGAKFVELFTNNRAATASLVQSIAFVGTFWAAFHCAEMMFGITIFSQYLSGEGFIKVCGAYLLSGVAIGVVVPLVRNARTRN